MRYARARTGFTIFELVVVLAVLLMLAAVTLPSFVGLKGNAEQRSTADRLRGLIADARGLAMAEGSAYRLAISQDGTKIRLAPDVADFANLPAIDVASSAAKAVEITLDKTTLGVAAESDSSAAPAADESGWITLGTFLPNGTCREDSTLIEVKETNFPPIQIQLRGVTGTTRLLRYDPSVTGGTK